MKKIKKLLAVIISTAMIIGVLSAGFTSFAGTAYVLWVNGVKVDPDNYTISCGDGSAEFIPETNTLILKDAVIENSYEVSSWEGYCIYSEITDLTIVLEGVNTIHPNSDSDAINIAGGCNVTIKGGSSEKHSLKINEGYYGIYTGSWGTEGGNLRIEDCDIIVDNTSAAGIWANRNIDFVNANVYVDRTSQQSYNGIVSNVSGTITVDNSNVQVLNNAAAMHFGNGDDSSHNLVVKNGSFVSLVSFNDDERGQAIRFEPDCDTGAVNGSITIGDGILAVNSKVAGVNFPHEIGNVYADEGYELSYVIGDGIGNPGKTVIQGVLPYRGFPDVSTDAWYFSAVKYCAQRGFIAGYQNGKFGPADSIQRQDFVLILARVFGADLDAYANVDCGLKDVVPGAYYAAAISWSVDNGLVYGYQNGNFGVGDQITREQICTILYRYFYNGDMDNADDILSRFPDKGSISPFAVNGVAWCVNVGFIGGMQDGRMAPVASASRAEIARIIMNMETILADALVPSYA